MMQSGKESNSFVGGSIRVNVVLKDDESKKVSIIARHNIKIQELKRKIQREYQELLNHKFIVGLIEDQQGFTISNNSQIGEHILNGDTIYVIQQKIDLNNQMHLGSDLQENFLTQRFITNSFAAKMIKIIVPEEAIIEDILPEILYLGFWFNNREVVLCIAKMLLRFSEGARIGEYFNTGDIIKEKGLLLTLIQFWIKSMNVLKDKEFFLTVIGLLRNLSRIEKFANSCKVHSLMQSLIHFSKHQGIETIHQNELQKIITTIIKGKSTERPNTFDYFKSRDGNMEGSILNENYGEKYEFESALEMLKSDIIQTKNFGLEIFQKNNKIFASEILSNNDTLQKMQDILSTQMSKVSERTINSFLGEITQRVNKQKAVEMLHRNFLVHMNRILQECSPSYHPQLQSFIGKVGESSEYQGSVQSALKHITNPYKSLQQLALRIIQKSFKGDHRILKQTISKHMKQLIIASLEKQATPSTIITILTIINNTLLQDQSRIQFLALKGLQVLTKMIYHPQVEIQRLSAKGLLNISLSTRENKIKVLSSLSNFLENMFRNKVDKVVEGYLQTMIQRK